LTTAQFPGTSTRLTAQPALEIGITCTLHSEVVLPEGAPEDAAAEYDSESTLIAISEAIASQGYTVRHLGYGRKLLQTLLEQPPDLVFNFAEGIGGRSREAQVPAVLEMLNIPYTHSDPLTLAVTQDKAIAKRIVASFGLATPPFRVIHHVQELESLKLQFPLFAKPLFEGSSMGIKKNSRVQDHRELAIVVESLLGDYQEPVLVEEFCPGAEFSVAVVGTGESARVLGTSTLKPLKVPLEQFVYTLDVKRSPDWTSELTIESPPTCSSQLVEKVEGLALRSYRALGCRDIGRVDVRIDATGTPCFLELNALPGLAPGWSDLCLIAAGIQLSYNDMIALIVNETRQRYRI
jgi:D-alanine-D-alanine ligase